MSHVIMNVGKSVSCEGCIGNTVGNREVCKALPACFVVDKKGAFQNVVFVKQTAMGVALEGAK